MNFTCIIVKANLMADSSTRICKYCLDEDRPDEMIVPCLCKGSQLWVHRDCLNRWRSIGQSRFYRCEICLFVYEYEPDHNSCIFIKQILKLLFCVIVDLLRILGVLALVSIFYVIVSYPTGVGGMMGDVLNGNKIDGTAFFTGLMLSCDILIVFMIFNPCKIMRLIKRRWNRHKLYAKTDVRPVRNRIYDQASNIQII